MIGSAGSSRAISARAMSAAAAALAEAEERPRAFAEALDQPGFGQQPQMARQPRLRLAQDFGEIGDGQFGLGEQRQDAQPRRFAGRLERGGEGRKGEGLCIHGP